MRIVAGLVFLLVLPRVFAADAQAVPWKYQASEGNCAIRHDVVGRGKSLGDITVAWDSQYGSDVSVRLYENPPSRSTVRIESDGTGDYWEFPGEGFKSVIRDPAAAKLKENLGQGHAINVVIQRAGRAPERYTTGAVAAKESVLWLEGCMERSMNPGGPPPRWAVDMQRGWCAFGQGGFGGAPGLFAGFNSFAGGVNFYVHADERVYAKGGVVKLQLPGRKDPWIVDSEMRFNGADPVAAAFLEALRTGRPVPASFTARDAPSAALDLSLAGMREAAAMFDACVAARAKLPGGKPPPAYIDVRYSVDESVKACEITGVYQVEGVGIWLALSTDGAKHVLKLTQRRIRSGQGVAALDMSAFGGPRDTSSPDATVQLNELALGDVRRDMLTGGRDFQVRVSGTRYGYRFGGDSGPIEAAMFDACVRAKYPALK